MMLFPPFFLCFFTLLILLSILFIPTSGFAAWMKCNRYLEEDEIVMNNRVRKAKGDDETPMVKLAVYDSSGSRVDVPSEASNGDAIVWIDHDVTSSRKPIFDIRLDPETLGDLSDIQFVVETTPFDEDALSYPTQPADPAPAPNPAPFPSDQQMTAEHSSFLRASAGGGIMCDGRRGHGRGKSSVIQYQLGKKDNESSKDDIVFSEIFAGWSEYHGPVNLSPKVIFKRGALSSTVNSGQNQEEL